MLACSAATYAWRYGCAPGRRAVVFGAHDGALAAAVDLADAGIEVAAVLDVRHAVGRSLVAALAGRGIVVRTGTAVRGTLGDELGVLRAVQTSTGESIEADLLAVSGGWNPAVELFSQSGGRTVWSTEVAGFVPDRPAQPTHSAGACAGAVDLVDALRTGAQAGVESARAAGFEASAPAIPTVEGLRLAEASPAPFFLVESSAEDSDRVFVDLQRDATLRDIQRAVGAGLTSVEHIKRYTTIGTAADQGRGSGVLAVGVLAQLSGRSVAEIGTTTYRPPYSPISFAVLAGRDRGPLADPERVTAIHDWHVEHGAVFEDVGQWKRPWFFPLPGESADEAVRRECRAARTGVAMMDASTLGTIELQGADVGVLLDRLYTNLFSTLRVGYVRYGVMCGVDGMVLDDGTTARLDEGRWLMSTTTGNAAKVLEWLEEWQQTEWPSLDVRATSVTDNWSTIALVGPCARDVLARLAPELDCSVESFPFMTIRYAEVGGIPARIMRVSFSGELAYEINVVSWHALAMWEAVHAAGQRFGIMPYGTETMHVLRAEKGYPIVGQDTDGTVTPLDLGMSWIVSKKKPDFVGKRSFARADTARTDRPQLVGLVPVDGRSRVVEGAQLVPHGANLGATPVPMHGHVTSSYDSVALGTPFALALLDSGASRHGEVLDAVNDGVSTAVRVGSLIPYDPAGERRDG
jgi:sarcosine oxidase subunit alpha